MPSGQVSISGGNYLCIQHATPTGFRQSMERITRPGVSGLDIRFPGRQSFPFTWVTQIDVGTYDNAVSEQTTSEGLIGQTVSIVDVFGKSWSNILVVEAKCDIQYVPYSTGIYIAPGPAFHVTCQWKLQRMV